MARYGLDMADNSVTIITEGRNLRALPFRTTEDQLSTGKAWEDWLESIEREFRYFRITNPTDRKDALLLYGGAEIARLEKSLPDENPERDLDEYQILKNKLNAYFLPKKNKHYARYIFLKTRPETGEATVTYETRLREKAHECEFGNNHDDRVLEHLIQTIENQLLIQRCISKGWTLQQFLSEAAQIEDISIQVNDMKADPWTQEVAKVAERRRNLTQKSSDNNEGTDRPDYCTYCGLTRAHPKGRNCLAYGALCNICKKFNHFTSVCRANMSQMHEPQQRLPRDLKKKQTVKKAEETYSSSEMSSDDEFLEKSVTNLRIKTVNESMEENRVLSQEIALLEGKFRELENELKLAKQLIQSALKQQPVEKSYSKERIEEIETFQTNTLNETYKKTNGVLFDMPFANLTDLKVWQIADEAKTEEHQKLCSEELQARDTKIRRRKKRKGRRC